MTPGEGWQDGTCDSEGMKNTVSYFGNGTEGKNEFRTVPYRIVTSHPNAPFCHSSLFSGYQKATLGTD